MDTLSILAENKDMGMGILILFAMGVLVKVFLAHIKEENILSRDTHEKISENSMSALKEVTAVISSLHESNVISHNKIENGNEKILDKVKETHKKIEDIHYQTVKK